MNILHVMERFSPEAGGPQHAVLGMAHGVVRRGHSATIAYVKAAGREASFPARALSNITTLAFPPSFPKRLRPSRLMIRWMRKSVTQFDVVHIHAIFSIGTLAAGAECRRAGVPYIVRPHGSLDPYDLRKKGWIKKLAGPLFIKPHLSGAAAVHCTSRREAERLETYGAHANVIVAPLPIIDATRVTDPSQPDDDGSTQERSFRETLGVPAESFVVLFMSRLDKKKNLEVVIDAIRKTALGHPNIHLAICGSGDPAYETRLRVYARDVGAAGLVTFCGFLRGRRKADALLESDVFVLPSSNENYGVAVVEALHAGLPVVCSDQVYISDDITEAQAGIVCPSTPADVSAALVHLLEDRARGGDLLMAMGRNGQELARGRFSDEGCVPALLEMYESARVPRSAAE